MTKRHSVLQKKLRELESILVGLFSIPPGTPYDHQHYAQDIEQRFKFLRTLLSAEIAPHQKRPYHLQQIASRLTELETLLKSWDCFKALPEVEHFEPVANCSCTESCLYDDGEGDDDGNGDGDVSLEVGSFCSKEKEKFYEGLTEEENAHDNATGKIGTDDGDDGDEGEAERDVKKEEKRVRLFWKYLGFMGAGIVIGMALMGLIIVRFSDCFNHPVQQRSFRLTPT